MMSHVGKILNTKVGSHICLFIMAAAIVTVCGDTTFVDTDLTNEPVVDQEDFKKVWELYILPRLEYDLRNRLKELENINQQNFEEYERLSDLDGEFFQRFTLSVLVKETVHYS